tara:strand:- start:731 stop:1231 length:501 start_codon:yes stop_codon:yes gene_type:complete
MKNLIFFFLSVFLLASCNDGSDDIDPDNTFTSNYDNILFEDKFQYGTEYIWIKNNRINFYWDSVNDENDECAQLPINGNLTNKEDYQYVFETGGPFLVTPLINKGDTLKLQLVGDTNPDECNGELRVHYLEFVVEGSLMKHNVNECRGTYDQTFVKSTKDIPSVCN